LFFHTTRETEALAGMQATPASEVLVEVEEDEVMEQVISTAPQRPRRTVVQEEVAAALDQALMDFQDSMASMELKGAFL